MSEEYEPIEERQDESVTMPSDGDALTAASVRASLEEHSNAIELLQERVTPATAPTIYRYLGVPIAGTGATIVADQVGTTSVNTDGYPAPAVSCTGTWQFCYLLDLPHGSRLRAVRVFFYEDTDASAIAVYIRTRDYEDLEASTGEGPDVPVVTSLGADGTEVTPSDRMKYVDCAITAHTIDRSETGVEYLLYLVGSGGTMTRFMTKVRAQIEFVENDKGAG